ncbi:MAG: SagB/ThcOx family dehydrogenase [Chloroflexi bacterium]|nr:SagB/ThcOx family dehydrogenase [Chloroflexota bacterium]
MPPTSTATRPSDPPIALPPPRAKGTLSLEETLARRRSVREFTDAPLTLAELGQLLWAAQGITHPAGLRAAPSAGALYPLEAYAVTRDAVYRYEPAAHQLIVHTRGDARAALYTVALLQDSILRAPTTIVIAAVYARTSQKYGEERTPRYVALEAGHAAQNILLQAVALDLGAVPLGAFLDDRVQQALALPREHQPLYLIPVGHPK